MITVMMKNDNGDVRMNTVWNEIGLDWMSEL
jgi:hypothetical protein